MRTAVLLLLLMTGMAVSAAAQQPASAESVLQEARATAARENKNVFILFHASWCGWCHKMDTAMNDRSVKAFFDNNYVIRHLTVYESDKNKHLENPGALELLTKYHGGEQGIPYWLVFDKDGKLLADSKIRKPGEGPDAGSNSGCPASEAEVEHFIKVLKQTSPLQDSQLSVIRKRFRENEHH